MTGIPSFNSKNYYHLPSSSSNGLSNLVLTSPVEQELCEFLQELNRSSSLGLTGSELLSLVKGNFVLSESNFRVQGPSSIPLCPTEELIGDQSGTNFGLNTILPGAGRHFEGPPRAVKSLEKERTTTGRPLRLNTFSTAAGLKSQCGRKNPKFLSCSHESFSQNDVNYATPNRNSIRRTTSSSKSKSSGSGHQSKCHSSSEADSFQCRVIKLAQREHLILQRYEKLTKSIEKLNKESTKKTVQLFLLARSQEVHISGKDFEYARTNLLSLIRLSQVWWDKRRPKGVSVNLTPKVKEFSNLPFQERLQKKMSLLSKLPFVQRGPKSADIYSMTEVSSDTSAAGESEDIDVCKGFPDFNVTSPAKDSKSHCFVIPIRPKRKHDILVSFNEEHKIVRSLNKFFRSSNVRLIILRIRPEIHIIGPTSPEVIMKVASLVQKMWTEKDIQDWLVALGVPPCTDVDTDTDDEVTEGQNSASAVSRIEVADIEDTDGTGDIISNVQPRGNEVISKRTTVGGIFQLFPQLCANFPDCSNTSPSRKISTNCIVVNIESEIFHRVLIEADQTLDIMQKISCILAAQKIEGVKVSLLRKSPAFHVLSEDHRFAQQANKYLSCLMWRCRTLEHLQNEFENRSADPTQVPKEPQPPPLPKRIRIPPIPIPPLPPVPPLQSVLQPPTISKVTKPRPEKTPKKRAPPSRPKPSIAKRNIPAVFKPTAPYKPRLNRAENTKLINNVGPDPKFRKYKSTPNQQRSRAWESSKPPDVWQTRNSWTGNLPLYAGNHPHLGPTRMPFGQDPFFGDPQNNNPWQPECPPLQIQWQPQQQYPPFPPPQFHGDNNAYYMWNHGGGNYPPYPQNNIFW